MQHEVQPETNSRQPDQQNKCLFCKFRSKPRFDNNFADYNPEGDALFHSNSSLDLTYKTYMTGATATSRSAQRQNEGLDRRLDQLRVDLH